MSKTAEEILRQELNITAVKHGEDPVLNEDWDDWKDEQGQEFMNAMWDSYAKFAAQEVEAYKANVLRSILNLDTETQDEWHSGWHAGIHAAMAVMHQTKSTR